MKTFYKKTSTILTMICLGLVLISSCKRDEPEVITYGNAKFRLVNAVPGSTPQDFYQGDTKVSTSGVAYGGYSEYLTVKAGNSNISFRNTGSVTAISASVNVTTQTDDVYTVFYYPNAAGSGQITGFADDNSAPATGKAKVKFVNLGLAFNNTLSIAYSGVTGKAIVTGLAYDYTSAYNSIDPNVDLVVTVGGSASTTIIPGTSFVAGKNYTVWFDAATSTSANYHVIQQN